MTIPPEDIDLRRARTPCPEPPAYEPGPTDDVDADLLARHALPTNPVLEG